MIANKSTLHTTPNNTEAIAIGRRTVLKGPEMTYVNKDL